LTYGRNGDQGEALYSYSGFEAPSKGARARRPTTTPQRAGRTWMTLVEVIPFFEHDSAIFEVVAK
jgi:hypothetical protein